MDVDVPFLSDLEGVWEFIIGHAWFAPCGLSELHFTLFWRFVLFIIAVLLLSFEMEIRRVTDHFL